MANSVWQATIQNAAGDIVGGALITVIDEGTGLNATIFSSKAGAALTNPFNADAGGFAQFYSGPGEYRITAKDLGTGLTQTFDNWRLGDAGARDVGTSAGEVLLSEDLNMDSGETNYTSGNLNPNIFRGDAGSIAAIGWAVTSSVAYFALPISALSTPVSITQASTFDIVKSDNTSGGSSVTPTLGSLSTWKIALLVVTGLAGLSPGDILTLRCGTGSSIIEVNF